MRDRQGRTLEDIELIKAPRPGQDLRTSIDLRVQYLAYRALKQAVQVNEAQGGSVVVLDIETGEVLAMVNQPAFNPNDREQYLPSRAFNRDSRRSWLDGGGLDAYGRARQRVEEIMALPVNGPSRELGLALAGCVREAGAPFGLGEALPGVPEDLVR